MYLWLAVSISVHMFSLLYVSVCSAASPTPVCGCIWYSYLCVPLSLLPVSLCFTLSATRIYVFHCLSSFHLCVSLPVCCIDSPLPLYLCSFACHIFISVFHCLILLSTCSIASLFTRYVSVFHCTYYSYPFVPSPLFLYPCIALFDTPIPVFCYLYYIYLMHIFSATRLPLLHCLCQLYLCVSSRVLLIYSIRQSFLRS